MRLRKACWSGRRLRRYHAARLNCANARAPHAAETEGLVDPAGQLAALCGPQASFRSASVRMCLSSDRSHHPRRARVLLFERNCRSSVTPNSTLGQISPAPFERRALTHAA